jgi:hypothetical protein
MTKVQLNACLLRDVEPRWALARVMKQTIQWHDASMRTARNWRIVNSNGHLDARCTPTCSHSRRQTHPAVLSTSAMLLCRATTAAQPMHGLQARCCEATTP